MKSKARCTAVNEYPENRIQHPPIDLGKQILAAKNAMKATPEQSKP
jgi:hypothetical protein